MAMVNLVKGKPNLSEFKPKEGLNQLAEFRPEENTALDDSVDLKRYEDAGGLSLRKLEIGLWLVRNRRNFASLLVGFLIVVIFLAWGSFFLNFGIYIFSGMPKDSQALSALVRGGIMSYGELSARKARDISVSNPVVVKTGAKYDFLVKVKNPNLDHFAHFDYAFDAGSGLYGRQSGFILPGQSKYLLALGETLPSPASRAKLVFDNIAWQRVDKKEIIDWQLFAADRLNIGTREEKFVPGQSSGLSENVILNRLEFVAYNDTPYNYYELGFNIILLSNDTEIGAYRHRIDRFMSGLEKNVDLTLPYNIGNVTKIVIEPEIDITASDIYIDIGEKYR